MKYFLRKQNWLTTLYNPKICMHSDEESEAAQTILICIGDPANFLEGVFLYFILLSEFTCILLVL